MVLANVCVCVCVDIPALVMTLAMMGKLCMQITVFVSLLYSIELFPTVIRYVTHTHSHTHRQFKYVCFH